MSNIMAAPRAFNPNSARSERTNRIVYTEADLRRVLGDDTAAFVRLANDISLHSPIAIAGSYHHQIDGGNRYQLSYDGLLPFDVTSASGMLLSNLVIPQALQLVNTSIDMLHVQDGYSDGYSDGYQTTYLDSTLGNTTIYVTSDSTGSPTMLLDLPTTTGSYHLQCSLSVFDSTDFNSWQFTFNAKNDGTLTISAITELFSAEDNPALSYAVAVAGSHLTIVCTGVGRWQLKAEVQRGL